MVKDHMAKQASNNGTNLGFEAQLRAAADKLRGNMEPSDYKHVALGLIFLKYTGPVTQTRPSRISVQPADISADAGHPHVSTVV